MFTRILNGGLALGLTGMKVFEPELLAFNDGDAVSVVRGSCEITIAGCRGQRGADRVWFNYRLQLISPPEQYLSISPLEEGLLTTVSPAIFIIAKAATFNANFFILSPSVPAKD